LPFAARYLIAEPKTDGLPDPLVLRRTALTVAHIAKVTSNAGGPLMRPGSKD